MTSKLHRLRTGEVPCLSISIVKYEPRLVLKLQIAMYHSIGQNVNLYINRFDLFDFCYSELKHLFFVYRRMNQNQLIFTLWSREGDFAQIRVHYNKTYLSRNLRINATKFVLLHNSKPKCFWNVRFLNKQGVPKGFYEEVANNTLTHSTRTIDIWN